MIDRNKCCKWDQIVFTKFDVEEALEVSIKYSMPDVMCYPVSYCGSGKC